MRESRCRDLQVPPAPEAPRVLSLLPPRGQLGRLPGRSGMAGVGDRARIYCSHPRRQNWLCGGAGVSAYPGVQPQARLHTQTHTPTLHGALMSQHGQTRAPSPPPGTQTCTDRLRCAQTFMFPHSSTCTLIHAHQPRQMCTSADVWLCTQGHSCVCIHTPKSTCTSCASTPTHAHRWSLCTCTPQKCTHMNTHELPHTDTAACLCPHSFCLPGVPVGAPCAAAAHQPLSGV